MAVIQGDTFVVPVQAKDESSKAFKAIESNLSKLTGTFGSAVVVFNQSAELISKASRVVSQSFDKTIGSAIALEKNVAEVATLISGDATEATAKITKEILDLQSQFGSGQADLAKSFYQAISSGAVDATNAQELLTVAQKLAVGGVTTLATATDGLTSLMNAYGVSADDATSISDALFLGMRAGKTTVEELSRSLGLVADIAKNTGVEFDELIASVSAITTGGVTTAQSVTRVRAAMVSLSRQTTELRAVLDELGIQSIQTKIKQDGLVETLKEIVAQTDGTSETLTKLFGDVEAVGAVVSLTSDTIGGKFVDIMNDMGNAAQNAGEQTEAAFQKIAATTDFQLNVAVAKVTVQLTKIGNALKPIFVTLLNAFVSLVDAVGAGIDSMIRSFDEFLSFTKDLNIFTLTMEGLGQATDSVGSSIETLGRIANAVITPIINSVKILVKGLTAAFTTLAIVRQGFMSATQGVDESVKNINALIDDLDKIGKSIGDDLVDIGFAVIGEEVAQAADVSKKALSDLSDSFKEVEKSAVQAAKEASEELKKLLDQNRNLELSLKNLTATEADRIRNNLEFAKQNIKVKEDELKAQGKLTEAVQKQLDKQRELLSLTASAELQTLETERIKAQTEAIDGLIDKNRQLKIEELTANNQLIDAQKLKNQAALEAFDKEAELLKKNLELREDELKLIDETREALIKRGEAELGQAGRDQTRQAQENSLGGAPQLFGPQEVDMITSAFGEGAGIAAAGISGALSAFTAPIAAANMIVDAIQGLVDSIPNLLNNIADLLNSIVELPGEIVKGIGRVIDGIENLISNFIPNLAKAIPKIIRQVFIELPTVIVDSLNELFRSLPDIIDELIDEVANAIPDIIVRLVENLGSIVAFLVQEAPAIAFAIVEAMLVTLPMAMFEALVETLRRLGGMFSDLFKGIFPVKEVSEGIKNIGDEVSRSTSQLFKVADEEAARRGFDAAKRISVSVNTAAKKAGGTIWDKFKAAVGRGVATLKVWGLKIWNGLNDAASMIGMWGTKIWEFFIKPAANWFGARGTEIWNGFIGPVAGWFGARGTEIWNGFFKPIGNWFGERGTEIWNSLKNGLGELNKIFEDAFSGFFEELRRIGGDIAREFKNAFNIGSSGGDRDVIANATEKVKSFISKPFAHGGLVTGYANGGFVDVPSGVVRNGVLNAQTGAFAGAQGTDTIRAALTPGEFVVNRNSTRENLGLLSQINESRGPVTPASNNSTVMNVTINAKTLLTPEQIKREVAPVLEKEIRRKSQQGQFVLSTSGLRT